MRLIAALLAAVQALASAPEAAAQLREIVAAPVGTGVTVGVVGVQAIPATLTGSPATMLSGGSMVAPITLRQVALKQAPIRTSPIRSIIRAQALAGADSTEGVLPSPQPSTKEAAVATAATPASGRGRTREAAEKPLARMLLSPSIGTTRAFFDQAKAAAEPETAGVEDLDELHVFLVREGRPAVRTTLGALDGLLRAEPALAAALNTVGKVRVVVDVRAPAGGLQPADIKRAESALRARGVTAPLQSEKIAVGGERTAAAAPSAEAESPAPSEPAATGTVFKRGIVRPLTWPFREAAFLARSMKAAYTKPQFWEVIGGLGTEGVSFGLTATTYVAAITWQHPWVLGASLAMLLAQNAFHGFWLNTWTNFQDNLNKFRGPTYQTVFNWVYFQASGVVYRTLAWAAHPATTVAAWTLEYWKAIGLMSIVGTFCGVLGYNGLNQLYDKGRINRWQRSAIQQGRNLLFLGSGPLYGAGVLWLFWPLFWSLQALDLILFTASLIAKSCPVLYVADEGTALAPEFKKKYPATAAVETVSPGDQAKTALKAQPPVMLLLLLYKGGRYLWRKVKGAVSSSTSGPSGAPPPKT